MNRIKLPRWQSIVYFTAVSLICSSSALATPAQVPLESKIVGAGIDPNVMILLDTSLSMDAYDGNPNRRIRRAKDAIRTIINNNENVRFCLATFDQRRDTPWVNRLQSNGAYMNQNRVCGAPKTTLIAELDNIFEGPRSTYPCTAPTECYAKGTPTSSALYDVVQYFKTPSSGPFFGQFDGYASYPDPILGTCQQNIVIIATDGYEWADWTLASPDGTSAMALPSDSVSAADSVDGMAHSLPRWADGYPNNEDTLQGKNASKSICRANSQDPASTNPDKYNNSACLDDLALFAHQQDLRTGTSGGIDWDPPLQFTRQELDIHTIGLNLNAAILQSAADFGGGSYKIAGDANSIETAFSDIISGIAKVSGTESDITASGNSFFVSPSGIDFYITSYNTDGWFGELYSYKVKEDSPGNINPTADLNWKASEHIPAPDDRTLFTHGRSHVEFSFSNVLTSGDILDLYTVVPNLNNEDKAIALDLDNLSPEQLTGLGVDPVILGLQAPPPFDPDENPIDYTSIFDVSTALLAQRQQARRILDYISGDIDNEAAQSGGTGEFRNRTRTIDGVTRRNILGDIIRSRPVFIHDSDFGYPDTDYAEFLKNDEPGTRDSMVYINANDGIVHAINAITGTEKWGFVPDSIFSKIRAQSELNFDENHQIYIDGQPTGTDAKLDDDWQSIYISPFGAGAKGMFMLNVTDPDEDIDDIFEWEINEETNGYSDMGFIINQAKVTRLKDSGGDEHWVAIVGNGVHSTNGAAVIYIINLEDGSLFQTPIILDTGLNSDGSNKYASLPEGNGATDVAAVAVSSTTYVDRIYAGTLKGEMWRLDYDPTAGNDGAFVHHFESAGNASVQPFFTANTPDAFDFNRDGDTTELVQQPISGSITVTRGPSSDTLGALGGHLVSFGTGRYFDHGNIEQSENLKIQSFYTLWDTDRAFTNGKYVDGDLDRDDLQSQNITDQYTLTGYNKSFRDTSSTAIDWAAKRGWYVDLNWDYGERVIGRPLVLFDRIAFKTIVPTEVIQDVHTLSPIDDTWLASSNNGINQTAACNVESSGLHGWYMQFNRTTGNSPLAAVFQPKGADGAGISGETTTGSNLFQNPVILQKSDGSSSYINIDVTGTVYETDSGAEFQRSSWRRLH